MPVDESITLSILLPAYNAEQYIEDALNSILNQTFQDFELLVADDGSNDNTKSILEKFASRHAKVKCYHNESNKGKTATVNSLYNHSKGKYISIHDADDLSFPNRFEKQIEEFEKDSELALCGTSFLTINEKGFVLEYNKMCTSYEVVLENIYQESQFHGPTMMMRRFVLEELREIYRPYFKDNYEDTDLALRIAEKYKAYNLPEYLYLYRILDSSLCRRKVDIRNRNLYKVVSFLGRQRKERGFDYLMEDNSKQLEQFLFDVTLSYRLDPALIYREAANYYFYWKLYKKATNSALQGVIVRPWDGRNFKTLLHILKKQIFRQSEPNQKHYKEIVF